ncbi:hypothetical protein PtB15_4B608 [Puccinia triticina]|nr:hypothetical protein PtB15_4B608 [Puccinia triticina]
MSIASGQLIKHLHPLAPGLKRSPIIYWIAIVSKATLHPPAHHPTRARRVLDAFQADGAASTAGGGEVSLPPPLLVTIAKLKHQLLLLTQPRHLDSISRRVKVIVTAASSPTPGPSPSPSPAGSPSSPATKLLRPHQRPRRHCPRAPLLPPDALHRLDRLYSLLPRLDPLLPLVPHLLSRLCSLAHLHASADSFRARLDDALNGLRATSDRTAHLSKLLSTI